MNKRLKILIAIALISIAVAVGYKVYADYCYTSGINGSVVTFMSPKDYNFNIGTVYNDEYTLAGEPNGNSFSITDSTTISWYLPSGSWGISATMMNVTYFEQYFSTMTVTATFNDASGAKGTIVMTFAQPQSQQIILSGVDSGHITVTISGIVNPALPAGQVNIGCTQLVEWCPDTVG